MKKLTFTLILLLSITASLATDGNSTSSVEQEVTVVEGSGSSEDDTTPVPTTTTERPDSLDCQGECPVEDPVVTSVYLAHLDCEKFCQCSNGQPIVLRCPANLQFNTDFDVCDWPDSANCTGIGGVLQPPVVPPVNSILNKK